MKGNYAAQETFRHWGMTAPPRRSRHRPDVTLDPARAAARTVTESLSRRTLLAGLVGVTGAGALAACGATTQATGSIPSGISPAPTTAGSPTTPLPTSAAGTRVALTAAVDVATGLKVPWSAIILPDRSVLLSERDTAMVRRIAPDGSLADVGAVPGVSPSGEGGLLGLAIDPQTFTTTPVLYAYYSADGENRVVAMPYAAGGLGEQRTVLGGIPRAGNHNGGRLRFGPDGYLYVTTGDAGERDRSQTREQLGGKILRVTTTGAAAPGNPFGTAVWSWGHRNAQGIAWSAAGTMWASEFGQDTWDELNVITPGSDYGWPTVEGIAGRGGFTDPARQWRTSDASPSGICVGPDGAVLMAALRGESLWKIPLAPDGTTGEPQRLLQGTYGRLRDVLVGPDGNVWVVTNNTSRGTLSDGDDRIVRLPESLTG